MKESFRCELFPKPGKHNINGIFYSEECVAEMKNQLQKMIDEKKAYVFDESANEFFIENRGQVPHHLVKGFIRKIEGDFVECDIIDENIENFITKVGEKETVVAFMTAAKLTSESHVELDELEIKGTTILLRDDVVKSDSKKELE